MNIVVNGRFLTQPITGVQRFALEISKELKKIYGERVIFVAPDAVIHRESAEELGIRVIGKRRGHLWEQIDLPLFLAQNGSPLLLNLANTAPLLYNNKIVTLHDIAYVRFPRNFEWKFRLFYTFLIPKILRTSRHIFTVSQFSKQEIMEAYGVESSRISVVYNSINGDFVPTPKGEENRYILAVSSLHAQKNFHSLIEAFNDARIEGLKLYLVGSINRNFASSDLLEAIDRNRDIVFKGRVDDGELIGLYSDALFFVYPSLYEGFGIPPLEAQGCGCPVIVSNIGSLREVCGESALYCDPECVEDISQKITLLSHDEGLRQELRQRGFENIKRFSWEQSALRLIEKIEDLG